MSDASHSRSPSGVRIAADFRDNLIIDRYDPVFAAMRSGKLEHLRSENSEDAVTWNVFRTLRQLEPRAWLPALLRLGAPHVEAGLAEPINVDLWRTVSPPPALTALGSEGNSEIDVIIETPEWVWFIEAKYRSDISMRTTTRDTRDQVLRNIDVGSHYAAGRAFICSLLIRDEAGSPLGVEAVARYRNLDVPRTLLAEHRPDGLANLAAVTLLTWADLASVLREARDAVRRVDERGHAERALEWLRGKQLAGEGAEGELESAVIE